MKRAWRMVCRFSAFFLWACTLWFADRTLLAAPAAKVVFVAPQQFAPASAGVNYALASGGLGALCATKGAGYFLARVDLPPGAHIRRVEAEFEDSSEEAFGVVALFRIGETARDFLAMTPMSFARPLREVSSVELQEPEVVREGFQYWLHLTLTGPGVCLRVVRVLYDNG